MSTEDHRGAPTPGRTRVAQTSPGDSAAVMDRYEFRYVRLMLRPESWTRPAGASPAWVIAGEPSSRPRSGGEIHRAERGVKSLFGGSKRAGRSAIRHESCSLVRFTMEEPSRSFHGEGSIRPPGVPDMPQVEPFRGTGSGTYARPGSEQERPVFPALSAKTVCISRW